MEKHELQKYYNCLIEASKIAQDSSRKLIEWKSETGELLKQQSQVFPDNRDVEFLNCRGIGKRKKRGIQNSCAVRIPEAKFNENIEDFLQKYAISVRKLDKARPGATLENGKVYDFSLVENANKKGYSLTVQGVAKQLPPLADQIFKNSFMDNLINAQDKETVRGYLLLTEARDPLLVHDPMNGKIIIDPMGAENLIVTSELQGCTIYTKYDHEKKSLEVYHHRRGFDDAGKAREQNLAKEYNTEYSNIFRDEDYAAGIDN